jgi:hypothetical protein
MNKKIFLMAATFVAAAALSQSHVCYAQKMGSEETKRFAQRVFDDIRLKREKPVFSVTMLKRLITIGNEDFIRKFDSVIAMNIDNTFSMGSPFEENMNKLYSAWVKMFVDKKEKIMRLSKKFFYPALFDVDRKILVDSMFSSYKKSALYKEATSAMLIFLEFLTIGKNSGFRSIARACRKQLKKERKNFDRWIEKHWYFSAKTRKYLELKFTDVEATVNKLNNSITRKIKYHLYKLRNRFDRRYREARPKRTKFKTW